MFRLSVRKWLWFPLTVAEMMLLLFWVASDVVNNLCTHSGFVTALWLLSSDGDLGVNKIMSLQARESLSGYFK